MECRRPSTATDTDHPTHAGPCSSPPSAHCQYSLDPRWSRDLKSEFSISQNCDSIGKFLFLEKMRMILGLVIWPTKKRLTEGDDERHEIEIGLANDASLDRLVDLHISHSLRWIASFDILDCGFFDCLHDYFFCGRRGRWWILRGEGGVGEE